MTAALGAGLTAVLVEHVAWSVPLVVGHRPSSQRRTGPGSTRCRQWVGCYHWRDGYPSDVRRPNLPAYRTICQPSSTLGGWWFSIVDGTVVAAIVRLQMQM